MIPEIILVISIIGIFVIIVRKLPDALKNESAELKPQKAASFWRNPFKTNKKVAAAEEQEAVSLPKTNQEQRQELLSDQVFLTEGDQYLHAGKLKEAERAFLFGVAKNPKNPKLYNRLGAIYLKQDSYRDALEAFEAARDFDSSKASRHYNVALAAWHLKHRSKARKAISQAILLEPNSARYLELKERIENG